MKQWITLTEYVDNQTGEILQKAAIERQEYIKVKTHKTFEENEKYRINRYTYECSKNQQQKLEL